jgi:uncharacterized protein
MSVRNDVLAPDCATDAVAQLDQARPNDGKKQRSVKIRGYHAFQRSSRWFLYDLNANQFFQVERVLIDVLEQMTLGLSDEAITSRLRDSHAVEIVIRELREFRRHGFFADWYLSHVYDPDDAPRLAQHDTGGIQINLAQRCNLACKYCYLGQNDALAGSLMKPEMGTAAVDFAFGRAKRGRTRLVRINFFGGEPLLNKPLLKKLVEYAEDRATKEGFKVSYTMTTNGTLLDDDTIAFVQKHRFGLLISVDGGPDVQNKMRPFVGGKGSFDVVARNVKRLRQARNQVSARVTLSSGSTSKPEIIESLESLGFTKIGFGVAKGTVEGKTEWDITEEQQRQFDVEEKALAEQYFAKVASGNHSAYNPYDEMMEKILRPTEQKIRCGVGRGMTTITEEGKMYPCHRYVGMENWVIGTIQDGLDREKLEAYFAAYIETKRKCQGCWAQRLCGGVCPWYVSKVDGTTRPPGKAMCDSIKKGFEDAAVLLDRVRREHPCHYQGLVARYAEQREDRTDPN